MLGVAFNLTEGIENLALAIEAVRPHAAYIVLVYQDINNHCDKLPTGYFDSLENLSVDAVLHYKPRQFVSPHRNEVEKRNLALDKCVSAGCTYFLSLNADEVVLPDSLGYVYNRMKEEGWHSSACHVQTYYKYTDTIIAQQEKVYAPFIYRIDKRRFVWPMRWPVPADASRKMLPGKLLLLERTEVQLHRLTYVRQDEASYLRMLNSSPMRIKYGGGLQCLANAWAEFTHASDKALLPGNPQAYKPVRQTEDIEALVNQQLSMLYEPVFLMNN